MKQLYMVRHAKSSWENFSVSDFERPLNPRGNADAPEMARRLLKSNISIDLIICSTALRTRQTAEHFSTVLDFPTEHIQWVDRLYHASYPVIHSVISSIEDRYKNIMIVCHNPGITEFVNDLTDSIRVDDMPTCGIFAVRANIESWSLFREKKHDFLFFDYPKNI